MKFKLPDSWSNKTKGYVYACFVFNALFALIPVFLYLPQIALLIIGVLLIMCFLYVGFIRVAAHITFILNERENRGEYL